LRTWARVSLDRIAANYREFRRVVGPGIDVMAIVKADAYGHGAAPVARTLAAEGAEWFAVATVEEGVALRESGIGGRILVMGGNLPFEREALAAYSLTTVVHSMEEVRELDRLPEPVPFHLKIDSGMGRLGTRATAGAVVAAIADLRRARCEGLMTHLASAGDFTTDQSDRQIAWFEDIRRALAAAGIRIPFVHAASTAAVACGYRQAWHKLVRAGLGLYGYVPPATGAAPVRLLGVQPALEWKARLIAVKDLPEGAPVGYGGTFHAPRAMRIGIVSAGYADGVFRCLSNRGSMIADGRLTRIVGRVSMDVTTIDLSHTDRLRPGDAVTLIGTEGDASLDANEIAGQAGTISYEVLCAIGSRVRRLYQ
jgi:alanine racemase